MGSFGDSGSSLGKGALARPVVLILLISLSEGPKHGYRLLRDVDDITRGRIRVGTATVYHSLRRMSFAGLIEERPNGQPRQRVTGRREYRITESGRRVARAELEALSIVLEAARRRGLVDHEGFPD